MLLFMVSTQYNYRCTLYNHPVQLQHLRACCNLGTTVGSKIDVFLENFQTDLTPHCHFLEITLRFFPENPLSVRKFAMKFFGLAMTPPPLPPFLEITLRFFFSKIYRFEANKICNVIFWIGNDPPPS